MSEKEKRKAAAARRPASQNEMPPGEWQGAEDNAAPDEDSTKSHGELTEGRTDALPRVSQVGQSSEYASGNGEAGQPAKPGTKQPKP